MKRLAILLLLASPAMAQHALGVGGVYSQGPMPVPPSTATLYSNLQNQTGNPKTWNYSNGTSACSPSCPANYGGSSSQTFGVTGTLLSGNVMELDSTTSAANFSYNTLQYRQWYSFVPISGGTTTPPVSVNVSSVSQGTYTPGGSNNSITININASSTTHTITALQVYVDGAGTPTYNVSTAGPVAATITGLSDATTHTFAVKAFDSSGASAIFSFTESFGPIYGSKTNMMVKLDWQNAAGNLLYANEFDPRIDYAGYHYEFAVQCRLVGTTPVNVWYIWAPAVPAWQLPKDAAGANLSIPCDGSNGVKHSVWLWGAFDKTAHTLTYKALVADGAATKFDATNNTLAAASGASTDLNVFQAQVDQRPSSSGTITAKLYTANWFGWFW